MSDRARIGLVTGGGSGIGRAIALELVSRGYTTLVVGRNALNLQETCRLAGPRCSAVTADLTDDAGLDTVISAVQERYGSLDILVNNAGVARLEPVQVLTRSAVDSHLSLNVGAPLKLVSALAGMLASSPSSQVINISSEQSLRAGAGRVLYGATKAALNYATRALAAELAASGIRVNALLPGAVDTELLRNATGGEAVTTPLGEHLQPADVARWVGHLIDEPNVTGALITVDGGVSLFP